MIFLSHGKERANIIEAFIATMLQNYIYWRYLHAQHLNVRIFRSRKLVTIFGAKYHPISLCRKLPTTVSVNLCTGEYEIFLKFSIKTLVLSRHLFRADIRSYWGRYSLYRPFKPLYKKMSAFVVRCTFPKWIKSGIKNV